MSQNKGKLSRRNFLLVVGAGGAAGAAAVAVKTVPQAQRPATGKEKWSTAGYEATAHVRNYYRTAKV